VQFTFYTDRHESDDAAHRVAFLSAMVGCVGLAASGPRALSGHTTAFIVAVILLRGLQLLLYARASRGGARTPAESSPPARIAQS